MPDTVPFTTFADSNPPVAGVPQPGTLVSFIPMADVSDTGEWTNRQTRDVSRVSTGFTVFQENDVLFAKITPCMENGKGCHARGLRNGIGFGSTEFIILRAKGKNDARFVFHWTRNPSLRKTAELSMTGSAGQQRVQPSFFARFHVPPMSPTEQTAIAGILDTVDEAIRQTAAVIEKLKKIRAGLLHDLLTRGIDEDGQLRDPIRHPEQFNDSPLGRVPKAWEMKPLEALADIRFSSVDKKSHAGERRVRLCNYIDAYNNEYLTGSESFFMMATATEAEVSQFSLRGGDIVVTKDSETPDDIGIPCVITGQPTDLVCGYHLALIRHNGGQMNSIFLAKQLRHSRMARYFGRVCNGLTRYGLPTSAFSSASILVPPLPEQNAIAAILRGLDDRLREETRAQGKLTLIKRGLMQDLLTGRVRVLMRKRREV